MRILLISLVFLAACSGEENPTQVSNFNALNDFAEKAEKSKNLPSTNNTKDFNDPCINNAECKNPGTFFCGKVPDAGESTHSFRCIQKRANNAECSKGDSLEKDSNSICLSGRCYDSPPGGSTPLCVSCLSNSDCGSNEYCAITDSRNVGGSLAVGCYSKIKYGEQCATSATGTDNCVEGLTCKGIFDGFSTQWKCS